LHILICNERLLFRFGVDRVLILLGRGLKENGHTVSLMANRYDPESVKNFASQLIEVPSDAGDYLNMNEYVKDWLQQTWDHHFKKRKPDFVLIGGWPFFSVIPFFKKMGSKVIFMDCGAVPLQGYEGGVLVTQKKLRSLRKKYLQETDLITPISNFIANSQSKNDSHDNAPVHPILLGADHMEMSIWRAKDLNRNTKNQNTVNLVEDLKRKGRQTILNLGRWEKNCYKNSEAIFDLARKLKKEFIDCTFLVLAEPRDVDIPTDLKEAIITIGFPDDNELKNFMKHVDLGISVSLWEGFNLPLAEMQWLDRPVLVFDVGAHTEVVLHPWYLCRDTDEMANKASQILSKQGLDTKKRKKALNKFRKSFKWDTFVRNYCEIIQNGIFSNVVHNKKSMRLVNLHLIIDVTNASKDPANSGVIRVTRRLCRELQAHLDPVFVIWDNESNSYVLPNEGEYKVLGSFNGPIHKHDRWISKDGNRLQLEDLLPELKDRPAWILFTETIQQTVAQQAKKLSEKHRLHLGAIFYDAIPVLHPEFVLDEKIRNNHVSYMQGLAECDVIIPISEFSGQCLKNFWKDEKVSGSTVIPNLLPGEFGGIERIKSIEHQHDKGVRILCVSTIEPRKNHRRLIEACLLMKKEHPDLKWKMTFIGNRYAGAFELADFVESVAKEHKEIEWLGIVDDDTLHKTYLSSDFTIYASVIEGFGLPVLESVWHGKPCLCHTQGVMSELAGGGGCYTTDVTDVQALTDAIYKLATDSKLRLELAREAVTRSIKTWQEYTKEFLQTLLAHTSRRQKKPSMHEEITPVSWENIIYPECLMENWQMNHSERLALTAILERHQPKCSIEIGTFKGGSLSLISQYSVFHYIGRFLNSYLSCTYFGGHID